MLRWEPVKYARKKREWVSAVGRARASRGPLVSVWDQSTSPTPGPDTHRPRTHVSSGPDTAVTTCIERPDHYCATAKYTNKQCRHTHTHRSAPLPLRRPVKPTGLSHTAGFQRERLPPGFGWRIWLRRFVPTHVRGLVTLPKLCLLSRFKSPPGFPRWCPPTQTIY